MINVSTKGDIMKRLVADIDDTLYKELKILIIKENTTIKEKITKLVSEEIAKSKEKKEKD